MKTINIIFFLFIGIYCKAQSTIINIIDKDGTRQTSAYYKDVNNLLNPFEGTYIYTSGTTIFKMVLVKKVQQYNGRYYEDLIIGEYQYIENGVEKVNTLSELSTIYNNQRVHNIDGNTFINNTNRQWKCPECYVGEKRLDASVRDASTDRFATLLMRRTTENGLEVMKIKIKDILRVPLVVGDPLPPEFSLPTGLLTLIKQ